MMLGRTFELYVLGNIAQRSKASHCSDRALKGKCRKKSLRIFYSRTLLDISLVNPPDQFCQKLFCLFDLIIVSFHCVALITVAHIPTSLFELILY